MSLHTLCYTFIAFPAPKNFGEESGGSDWDYDKMPGENEKQKK